MSTPPPSLPLPPRSLPLSSPSLPRLFPFPSPPPRLSPFPPARLLPPPSLPPSPCSLPLVSNATESFGNLSGSISPTSDNGNEHTSLDHRGFLVGQTIPQPTGQSPSWGRVGGGGAMAVGVRGSGGKAAGGSSVPVVDRWRGRGISRGGGDDALLQVIGRFVWCHWLA